MKLAEAFAKKTYGDYISQFVEKHGWRYTKEGWEKWLREVATHLSGGIEELQRILQESEYDVWGAFDGQMEPEEAARDIENAR